MYVKDALSHAAQELRKLARAETEVHERFRRHITTIVVITIAIDAVGTALTYVLEHNEKQTQIKTVGSALFWTTSQLLTVSSSFQNPLTPGGQIIDVFMEIWAMIVVASLTASLGSFLMHKAKS